MVVDALDQSFNKYRTGTILCTVGGVLAPVIGVGGLLRIYRLPPYYEIFTIIFTSLFIGMIIGGIISLIGMSVAGSNPQVGGSIAIVGAIVGGINVLTLVGGILMRKGPVMTRTDASSTGTSTVKGPVPAIDTSAFGAERTLRTHRVSREKEAQKIRCPSCRKKIPATAMYCPECRALITTNEPD